MGIKGNLSEINAIPFEAPPLAAVRAGYNPQTQAVGVGYTPEGLDQNPACESPQCDDSRVPIDVRRAVVAVPLYDMYHSTLCVLSCAFLLPPLSRL